jgi:Fe-S cluster biogenesis protein NfuA
MDDSNLADCVERIDTLIHSVEGFPDASIREQVQEIVHCVLQYHGAALARLIRVLPPATNGSPPLLEVATQDPLVSSLLLLHDLHPADLETRVGQALEGVRPYLRSHGGNVELLGVANGVVRLRLEGSCHGCPSSAATLKTRIEQAILEAAPEVAGIEVDPATPSAPRPTNGTPVGFVALETLTAEG